MRGITKDIENASVADVIEVRYTNTKEDDKRDNAEKAIPKTHNCCELPLRSIFEESRKDEDGRPIERKGTEGKGERMRC